MVFKHFVRSSPHLPTLILGPQETQITFCRAIKDGAYWAQKKCLHMVCKQPLGKHFSQSHHNSMCIVRAQVESEAIAIHPRKNQLIRHLIFCGLRAPSLSTRSVPRMIPVSSGGTSIAMMPDSDEKEAEPMSLMPLDF